MDRARVRIALDDAEGARSELQATAAVTQVGWASEQLQFATTLARLALLEGRRDTAVELWSAVQHYRVANERLAPRLASRFEEPLPELELTGDLSSGDSRAALNALRALVSEEFAALEDATGR